MRGEHFHYAISLLLLVAIIITGILGYLQSRFDLRQFIPHRYSAYLTLILTALHVYLNGGKVLRYLRQRFKRR